MAKSSFVERNKAVREAWNKELELVQEGKGTREWTPEQQKDILERGRAYDEKGKAFEGQHMKSAEMYPEYQGEPGNIQFLTRAEHFEAHINCRKRSGESEPKLSSVSPVTRKVPATIS